MKRLDFVAGLVAVPALLGAAPNRVPRLGRALVLVGGGALGAYEGGIIEALRKRAGVWDGEPIPGIDVVCGTSIGALNGWNVATAQYSKLAELWHGIGSEHVVEIKRQFAAAAALNAFILTKIVQALALAKGLTTNVRGILVGETVQRWIEKHVDVRSALAIGIGAFGVAQSRIAAASLRAAYLETQGKRLFSGSATTDEQNDSSTASSTSTLPSCGR